MLAFPYVLLVALSSNTEKEPPTFVSGARLCFYLGCNFSETLVQMNVYIFYTEFGFGATLDFFLGSQRERVSIVSIVSSRCLTVKDAQFVVVFIVNVVIYCYCCCGNTADDDDCTVLTKTS